MPLLDGPSLGGNARHVLRQYAEENALARGRGANAAGTEEFGGGCLRGRYNNLREVIQNNPSLVVVPSIINAGSLFVQRPICRTNYLPNNSMAGATGSVLPTTWASGSIPAGFTFSVGASGQATANDGTTVNYVDVSVSGTATASGTFNLFFSAASGAVTATTGQTFTLSAYATCISGDITTPAMVLQVQEVSGSTFQAGTSTNIALASGAALQRVSAVRTFNQSGVSAARGRIGHPIVSGTTYSYTIRIASPQLERLGVPTPMITTSTGAVTRLNESTDVVGLPPDFTVSRNTTATRVNSSGLIESVASGVPRIDWLGQSCPALLVEASGQNVALQSEGFSVSGTWVPEGTNPTQVTANSTGTLDPAGGNTADIITLVSGSTNQLRQSFISTSGTIYTASIFFKNIALTSGQTFLFSTTNQEATVNQVNCTIDLANLTITAATQGAGVTVSNAALDNYGNGWYRARFTFSFAVGGNNSYIRLRQPSSVGTNYAFYVWGAQLETGSVATTYIPTTTAAVSRAADVISASGALVSGLIGQTEGTIYAEFQHTSNTAERRVIALSDGTAANRIMVWALNNILYVQIQGDNVIIANPITSGYNKVAFAYQQNGVSGNLFASINGGAVVSGTSTTYPSTLSRVVLGSRENAAVPDLQWNNRIRAAALYTTRLSNAQLAELTRL